MNALLPRILLPCLLAAAAAGADGSLPPPPWRETFSMPLAGREQAFVVFQGVSWMLLERRDLLAGAVLLGEKDVVFQAKVERLGDSGLRLPGLEAIEALGDPSLWRTVADGDNVYLFGTLSGDARQHARLQVKAVEPAPSDRQVIVRQLAGIPPTAWERRLKAVEWIRNQAAIQPNKEFWLNEADRQLGAVILDGSAAAERERDIALLNRVVGWCVDLARDPAKAGEMCSRPWLQDSGAAAAQELRRRLRGLGLEPYQDRWIPRQEALSAEFEARIAAIPWNDADGFFRLGRWADINAEFLPKAKERAYRCYQAGLRANPGHQAILNALGLAAATARQDTSSAALGPGMPPPSPAAAGQPDPAAIPPGMDVPNPAAYPPPSSPAPADPAMGLAPSPSAPPAP